MDCANIYYDLNELYDFRIIDYLNALVDNSFLCNLILVFSIASTKQKN